MANKNSRRSVDDIAVIGGGLGGITASIALRNAGFTTRVFESKPDFSELGVAVILSPNGVKALRSLGQGIVEAVTAKGRPVATNGILKVFHPNGEFMSVHRTFGDLEGLYGAPQITIRRNVFHQILLDAHGPDGLHSEAELTSYEDRGRQVTAKFANGRGIEAGLLIGADGLHSRVRKIMHVDAPPRYTGWSNLRGVTRGMTLPEDLEEGLTIIENHDHVMTCPVGREGDLYWSSAFVIDPGKWPRTPTEAHAEVLRRIRGWYFVEELVKNAIPETLNPREIRDNVPLPFHSKGRVALLGDAAHAMSNFWGQGANSALEDGVVLARHLSSSPDLPSALAAYDDERLPRTTRLVNESSSIERHVGDSEEFTRWIYSYNADSGKSLVSGAPV